VVDPAAFLSVLAERDNHFYPPDGAQSSDFSTAEL